MIMSVFIMTFLPVDPIETAKNIHIVRVPEPSPKEQEESCSFIKDNSNQNSACIRCSQVGGNGKKDDLRGLTAILEMSFQCLNGV